jgi:hypothetical protein
MSTKDLFKLADYFAKKISIAQDQKSVDLLSALQGHLNDAQAHFEGVPGARGLHYSHILKKISLDYANGFWKSLNKDDQKSLIEMSPITTMLPLISYGSDGDKFHYRHCRYIWSYSLKFGPNGIASLDFVASPKRETWDNKYSKWIPDDQPSTVYR